MCDKNAFSWSDLITNPGRKAFMIGMGLAMLSTFCGVSALICYTSTVFQEAGSTMSPNMSSIIVGTIQLFGSFITINLVDRAGRRVITFG